MKHLYIGIDGGGSRSTVLAADPEGNGLTETRGPGLNYLNDGLDLCVRRFGEMVRRAVPDGFAGAGTVCAGLAALDGPADREIQAAFQSALPPSFRLILRSDLSAALAGHTLGGPGMAAVCGTGSMALVRDREGRERAAGGWGRKIGDPGGGTALAQEGLFRALYLYEAEGRRTPLLLAALRFFSRARPRDLLQPLYAPDFGTDDLAAFGAEVVRLAEQEDPEAGNILERQMICLASLAAALLRDAPEAASAVGLYGGLFQHSPLARRLFSEALLERIPESVTGLCARPPAAGAVCLAMMEEGVSTEKWTERMIRWEEESP